MPDGGGSRFVEVGSSASTAVATKTRLWRSIGSLKKSKVVEFRLLFAVLGEREVLRTSCPAVERLDVGAGA